VAGAEVDITVLVENSDGLTCLHFIRSFERISLSQQYLVLRALILVDLDYGNCKS
jgi:hypothetical protein